MSHKRQPISDHERPATDDHRFATVRDAPPTESGWTIRPYRSGDERALTALFAEVFGRPISEAHWRWKLKGLPSPTENVWLATDAADAPVFQYAGIPTPFRIAGQDTTAMVSVDTMTAPAFQRRGLLSSVGRHTYAAWRAADVPFVIGLPNERWGSRANALGWQPLFQLQWLVRALRPQDMLAHRLHLPVLKKMPFLGMAWNALWGSFHRDSSVQVRGIAQAGTEFDKLWDRLRDDALFSVRRNSAWVQWRYLSPPETTYRVMLAERAGQPLGYTAYRLNGNVGLLAELFCAQDDTRGLGELIGRTVGALIAAGAERAVTLAVPGTPLYRGLQRAGFTKGRGAFGVQLVSLAPDLPLDAMRDPRNWSIAGGDFDVI